MTVSYVKPSSDGVTQEFLPTDAQFHVEGSVKSLKGLVARMAAISSKNPLLPGTDLLQMDAVETSGVVDGFLKLYATNGSISMRSTNHDVTVRQSGTVLVPTARLSAVLGQCESERVSLVSVGHELRVTNGNSLWRVQLPNHAKVPNSDNVSGRSAVFDVASLRATLSSVVRAAADGLSRVSLTQVRLGNGYAISCDGARMHRQDCSDLEGVEPFTIPTLGVKLFLALLKTQGPTTEILVTYNDNAVSLVTTSEEVSILRASVPFPDVENVFITQAVLNDTSVIVNRQELQEAVTRVKIFADEVLSGVSLTVKSAGGGKHLLVVHSKDDIGNFSASELVVTVEGKASVDLKLNYKHLQDALASTSTEHIVLQVAKSTKTSKTSAYLEDKETGFVAVIGQTLKEN